MSIQEACNDQTEIFYGRYFILFDYYDLYLAQASTI